MDGPGDVLVVPSVDDRTALYRFRDLAEALLYVGITQDPTARFAAHERTKPWWPDVANISIQWYDTRALAIAAEIAAIRDENPIHNKARPDEDGVYRFGVGRPRYAPPDAETAAAIERIAMLNRQSRSIDRDMWDAVALLRPTVPDLALCEMAGISRATLNRKLGNRSHELPSLPTTVVGAA